MNITNIVLASALVMAASGEASAQTTLAPMAEPTGGPSRVQERAAGSLEDGLAAEKRGDWKAAFVLLSPLAKQGNPVAELHIGYMWETGKTGQYTDAESSISMASLWYRVSAEQGNANAQENFGKIQKRVIDDHLKHGAEQGSGMTDADWEARYATGVIPWFRKAADQGYADGQYSLGVMYENGQGVPQDNTEAMKWYRKAAAQGDADAQKDVTRLNEQSEQDKKQDKIMKTMLAARKEIGDTVCYPSSCTGSSCDVYGQVERVNNDKIEVRRHLSSGFGTSFRKYDQLDWISYNAVVVCAE